MPRTRKPWREYSRYGSVGMELILSIGVGYYGGHWLDEHFHANGWLTGAGFFLGVYAGFRALFKTAQKMTKDVERAEKMDRGEDPWDEDDDASQDAPAAPPDSKKSDAGDPDSKKPS